MVMLKKNSCFHDNLIVLTIIMFKKFILTFLFLCILTSCNFKKLIPKNNELVYIDCPKSLILLAGSKKIEKDVILSINKNYRIDCFYNTDQPDKTIFEINYIIDATNSDTDTSLLSFDFWVFLTNKKENIKIDELVFQKIIDFESIDNDSEFSQFSFKDQVIIDSEKYKEGIKIFISLN